jgi:hypothetical protein
VSRMQRESPTDATVTVKPSMTTSVAVVPDTSPELGWEESCRKAEEVMQGASGQGERVGLPLRWKSMSALTNPATSARGSAWIGNDGAEPLAGAAVGKRETPAKDRAADGA